MSNHTNNVQLQVDVQLVLSSEMIEDNECGDETEEPPSSSQIQQWATHAYQHVFDLSELGSFPAQAELTVRLVEQAEMSVLNDQYRQKQGPTNVLSFPFDMPVESDLSVTLLGDIVICHSVVVAQAHQTDKPVLEHYAHMVTHGVLHLCGYDHLDEVEAQHMESVETSILAQQNIANPYT